MKPRLKKLLAFYQRRPWIVSVISAAVGALFGWLLFRVLWVHILPKLIAVPSVAVVDLIFIGSIGVFLASLRNGFADLLKGD